MHFEELVAQIRSEQGLTDGVPGFDPSNGNENARFLFLLEAPGPGAVRSGVISLDNADPSARRFKAQLNEGNISKADIAIWNLIPWYLGNEARSRIRRAKTDEIKTALPYLQTLIEQMPNLSCIILVGTEAAKAHVFLSAITTARIARCHHPSGQSMNGRPERHQENVEVFRYISATA